MQFRSRVAAALVFSCIVAVPAFAGFAANESFLPAIGRGSGNGGLEFFATVWATNLTGAPVHFTFDFLKQGQANTSPASFADTLAPGQTKVYENVVESKLGLSAAIGAARVTSDGEILVAERIYNQSPGTDLGATQGLFFAGVPKSFSISVGQSASIQGINQGGGENFRYNFALVETGGGSPTVNVQLFDGNGTLLGQKAYILQPYEQLQPNVAELDSGIATTNARITATVTGGSGSVLLAGAQLAAESLDSSGFEMSFRGSLLGGGGAAGVSSLNGLTGDVSLIAGNNVTITTVGNGIKIDAAGGSGGSGSLSLPFSQSGSSTTASLFTITNTSTTPSSAITGIDTANSGLVQNPRAAVVGDSSVGTGVLGAGTIGVGGFGSQVGVSGIGASFGVGGEANAGGIGVMGVSNAAINANPYGLGIGVVGSADGVGMLALATPHNTVPVAVSSALMAFSDGDPYGIFAKSLGGDAVFGLNLASSAVPPQNAGVHGYSQNSYGVYGESATQNAIFGRTASPSGAGVQGENKDGTINGYLGGSNYGVAGVVPNANGVNGVIGVVGSEFNSPVTAGVEGMGPTAGIYGVSPGLAIEGWHVSGPSFTLDNIGALGGPEFGAYGQASAGNTTGDGVFGNTANTGNTFVAGVHGTTAGGGIGVHGEGAAAHSWAVWGQQHSGDSTAYAGIFDGNVIISGHLNANGASLASFPHVTDASKEIHFGSLQGPEAGTYFRGSGKIVNGFATIPVPEAFRMVTSEKGLTVQVTPMGAPAVLYCVRKGLEQIVIQGNSDVDFDFTVNGIRKGYEDFAPITANENFVPRSAEDADFALHLDANTVAVLKANGVLNSDGSINLETAHRLGWDRGARWNQRPGRGQN